MATSGSTNFSVNRTNIIDAALRVIGVLRSGDTVTSHSTMETDCAEALNMMVKQFQNHGMELWTRKSVEFALSASNTNYTIAPGAEVDVDVPERVVEAYRRDTTSGNDTTLQVVERSVWDRQSDKTTNGTPTQVFYDFQRSQGVLWVWPQPSATGTNMVLVYQKPFDDMDAAANELDFPQRWYEAVKWGLAMRLAPEFGRPIQQDVVALAQSTLDQAIDAGYETGSVRFRPSTKWRR